MLRYALVGTCCVVASCVVPGPAMAEVEQANLKLQATDGFSAWAEVKGRRAGLHAVRSAGSRSTPAGVAVGYFARGSIARYRVRARFGGRGRINVKFRPHKVVTRKPPPHCKGAPKVTRTGVFVGTIRFHGERGYTEIDASRAPGKLRTTPRWKCESRPPPPNQEEVEIRPLAKTAASTENGPIVLTAKRKRTMFEAAADRYPREEGLTRFLAGRSERRPHVRIERGAYAFGEDRTFVFTRGLTEATVRPPWPFTGSASFLRGAAGRGWTGSLRVKLPGAGTVPLTGSGHAARLYVGEPEDSPGY